jgi:cupin 2 domain-containing protein
VFQRCNLYQSSKPSPGSEVFTTLFQNKTIRVESIRSWLKDSGEWYDQSEDEWVVLIEGKARLEIGGETLTLEKGDCLFIPSHQRHRVLWTSEDALWLGVFSS